MKNNVYTESMDQILHSIFEPQNFSQMDWQKLPSEYKKGTEIFNALSLHEVLFSLTVSQWSWDENKALKANLSDYP